MNWAKENWKILTIIAVTIYAILNIFYVRNVTDLSYNRLKEQKILTVGNKAIFTHLKLGLDLIGGSQLEFEAQTTAQVPEITQDVMRGLVKVFENRVNASGTAEAVVQQVGKNRIVVEVPGVDPQTVKRRLLATAHLEFKEYDEASKTWIETGITGADLKHAQASTDGGTMWVINFELQPNAAQKFGDLTARLIEKPLGIFLDGNILSSPVVRTAITGGSGQISGDFTADAAQDLAVQLNAGALPVPVKILQERSIGATLGQDSINKSVRAGAIGFLLVIFFMILVYRLPGIVSAIALSIYVLVSFYAFQEMVTLTLAGLTGFILSIGMAVDANILIFERAREEMNEGKSILIGVHEGFEKAYSSIFDSNMNTSIVCLILIMFGTGIVKGFAITLLIGIGVSLFSSLFITKTLLFMLVDTFKIKETGLFK